MTAFSKTLWSTSSVIWKVRIKGEVRITSGRATNRYHPQVSGDSRQVARAPESLPMEHMLFQQSLGKRFSHKCTQQDQAWCSTQCIVERMKTINGIRRTSRTLFHQKQEMVVLRGSRSPSWHKTTSLKTEIRLDLKWPATRSHPCLTSRCRAWKREASIWIIKRLHWSHSQNSGMISASTLTSLLWLSKINSWEIKQCRGERRTTTMAV